MTDFKSKSTLIGLLLVVGALGVYLLIALSATAPVTDDPNGTATTTDPSMVRLIDTAHLYSIEVPRDWKIVHEGLIDQGGSALKRLSLIEGRSPDWQTELSPPDNELTGSQHIVDGAAIEIYVFTQDIGGAPSRIHMSNTFSHRQEIGVGGEQSRLDFFKEYDPPLHEEALILEAIVTHKQNYFTFRSAFNPLTYPDGEDVFMKMLQSVKFTE